MKKNLQTPLIGEWVEALNKGVIETAEEDRNLKGFQLISKRFRGGAEHSLLLTWSKAKYNSTQPFLDLNPVMDLRIVHKTWGADLDLVSLP